MQKEKAINTCGDVLMNNGNLGMLFVFVVLLLFITAGMIVFIGGLRKWRSFMNPIPSAPPFISSADFIKKHTGEKGLRIYWLIMGIGWILGTLVLIVIAIKSLFSSLDEETPKERVQIQFHSCNSTNWVGTIQWQSNEISSQNEMLKKEVK